LHGGEVQNTCASPNIIRVIDRGGNVLDGAYSKYWEEDRCIQEFGKETVREIANMEDLDLGWEGSIKIYL